MLGTSSNGAQIVGVVEPDFELLFPPGMNMERLPDVWFAARLPYDAANRSNAASQVIGRLKPGATLEAAGAEAEAAAAGIRRIDPISESAGFHIRIEPMQRYVTAEVVARVACADGGIRIPVTDRLRQCGESAAGPNVTAGT